MQPTIALFASSRRNGNTGQLMDKLADTLDIEIVDLSEKSITPFDYEHRNRHDDFEPLIQHVLKHELIIFASPVYWYAVSPPMKAFLDRICDLLEVPELQEQGQLLRSKCAFVVCTSIYDDVPAPFIGAFRDTFDYLGIRFGGYVHANCENGYKAELYEKDIAEFTNRVRSVSCNGLP